jgi:hypothetical protein
MLETEIGGVFRQPRLLVGLVTELLQMKSPPLVKFGCELVKPNWTRPARW